jgi:hypothetical protein
MMSSLPLLGAAMTTATKKLKLTRIIDEATTRIIEKPRWSDASHDVVVVGGARRGDRGGGGVGGDDDDAASPRRRSDPAGNHS